MDLLRCGLFGLLAWWAVTAPVQAAGATRARLLLPVEVARPGDTVLAGVELTMPAGWHTYWRNGGDSGKPTRVSWKLPPGVSAGPLRYPAPERFAEAGIITYVHHGTALLLVPLTLASNAPAGPLDLSARVDWLECEKACIPGNATVTGRLTVGDTVKPSADASRITAAEARLPRPLPAGLASARWASPATTNDERTLLIEWKAEPGSGAPDFFPDSAETYEIAAATEVGTTTSGVVTLKKLVRKAEGEWPLEVRGLLARVDAQGQTTAAFETRLVLGGTTPDAGASTANTAGAPPTAGATGEAGAGAGATGADAAVAAPTLSLGRAILFGLLGGLILNIMPCVLPVIALKILGFVRQSGSAPAEVRKLGLIYGLGVWFSFLVLAGVVIAVKRASGYASWGMQFGNPMFLVAMTTLVTLVALSLFGVFEINLAGKAMDAAGDLASKEGSAGAFFNGMLAVALATPCTAPLLAPALGYAFAADALTVVIVFSAVAFGLASPYVVLSCQPAWLKFLPKPGVWMEHFKVAMGFPMLATAFWLYALAAGRFGPSGPVWLGLFLVGVSLAAWIWGQFVQRGRRRQTFAMILSGAVLVGIYVLALERELQWRAPRETSAARTETASKSGIPWQPWSPEAVAAARQQGRPVLVDFTADWCLTCELNERSSINIPAVRERLQAINAVVLKGDNTDSPPAISRELQRFGRAGVPLVLVYPKDQSRPPQVLPELLTPTTVLEALNKAIL